MGARAALSVGIPGEIENLLNSTPQLAKPHLLLGVAEHKVALPHGGRASQNDLWALVQTNSGVLSLAIEGKAGEDFDVTVNDWLANREPNSKKEERLRYLVDLLGITGDIGHLRYQLFHRTASAIIEARRFGTKYAAMIVQSFKNSAYWTGKSSSSKTIDTSARHSASPPPRARLARQLHRHLSRKVSKRFSSYGRCLLRA